MKRKLVVRTLALLLTSVMVMETPMQSFAAEAGKIEQSAGQEASAGESDDQSATQDGTGSGAIEGTVERTDNSGTSATTNGDNSAAGSNTDTQSGSGESGQDSNTEKKGGSGNSGSEEQSGADAIAKGSDGANTSNSSDSTNGDNSGGTADASTEAQDETSNAASNEQLNGEGSSSEEAVQEQKTTEVNWFIKASRFGKDPVSGYDLVSANESVESALKTAMQDASNAELSGNLSVKNVEQLIVKILESEKDNYSNISPNVTFVIDGSEYVTSVKFEKKSNGNASIESASSAENGNVTLKYSVQTGLSKVEFKRVPVDSDGNYSWENSTTVSVSGVGSEFVDTTAAPGDYAYILYGYTGDKVTIYSNVITCTYTLPEVKNFKVASTDRTGTTLSWDKLDPAQGYELTRTGSDGSTKTLGEFGKDTTTYTDTTTASDETYTYILTAFIKDGDTKRWTSITKVENVQAKSSSVSKPSLSFISPSSDQATLNWSGNAEGYELYKVNNGSYEKVMEVSATSYQLTGLEVGKTYSYAVCPFRNGNGFRVYGTMSDVVTVTTSLASTGIQASAAAYNQINLTWAQTAQADGYEIYRNDQLYKTVNGISNCYLADTVACGTTYNYKVRPFRKVNGKTVYGEFSAQVSAVTALPAAAMNKVTSVDYKTLDVSWNQGTGATGYELYRSTSSNSGFGLVKDITNGSTLTYRDTGLTIGTTYYYKVKAYRTENGKKVYAPETSVISGTVDLGTVTGVKATATAYNRIEITWNKMSVATGYELYYSTSPDGNYKFLKKLGKNSVKFKWSKAQCGVTYYFQIRPIQKVKKVVNYGSFSDPASAMAVIGSPTDLKVSKVTYNTVNLKWKSVKGAKRYKVYYSDSQNGTYQLLTTFKGKSAKLTNLETGKTYYFKVAAIRDNFESTMTGAVSAAPSMGNLSGLKAVSVSSSELQISWKALKGLEKYVILRSSSASGTYTQIGTTTKTSYTDTGLASGTTYYYKVYGMRGNYKTNECGPVNARTKDQGSINTNKDKKSIYKGIDVSSYQGDIDWDAVADDGVDFAMIRILTGKDASAINYDSKFKTNYRQARAAGLDVGVYRYSYARTRTQARKEAQAVIEALDGRKLDYPVVMDFEDKNVLANTSTNSYRAEIILAFKDEIEKAGYKFALYANKNWLENFIDTDMLGDTHIWIARWRSLESGHGYKGSGTVTMWQYTDKGSVRGISGNVDMDVSYKKYRQ